MQTAAKELGISVEDLSVEMATDSSGAKSFASRRGSGRIRHIEVKWLWLQQAVADGRFRMTKVAGSLNPADILTKYKGLRGFEEQLKRVNVHVMVRGSDQGGGGGGGGGESAIGGRASGGPRVVSWADALEEEQETRDINDAGMQHVDGSGRMIAAAEEECWKSSADQRPAGRKTRDGPMMLSAFLA